MRRCPAHRAASVHRSRAGGTTTARERQKAERSRPDFRSATSTARPPASVYGHGLEALLQLRKLYIQRSKEQARYASQVCARTRYEEEDCTWCVSLFLDLTRPKLKKRSMLSWPSSCTVYVKGKESEQDRDALDLPELRRYTSAASRRYRQTVKFDGYAIEFTPRAGGGAEARHVEIEKPELHCILKYV